MPGEPTTLRELALLFLRLGTFGFGGPAAHIALMRDELVKKRAWLSDERFLDLLGACNVIPGPNSTELAIHIGYERRRWSGLLIAGVCFILPAALMTSALGALYLRYGTRPEADAVSYGVQPVMLAIVLQALWALAPKAASDNGLRVIGALSLILALLGVDQLLILPFGALARLSLRNTKLALLPLAASALVKPSVGLSSLFLVFAKVGSLLFGSGYVLLSLLRTELVTRLGWLSERQLLDAIAVGQVTPGPLFTSATFIGYLLQGGTGAVVATCGIFAPAFVFVALSAPYLARLRESPTTAALLDGVNVASVALLAAVLIQTARAAIVDLPSALLALASAALLLRARVGATWLLALGAALGLAVHTFR